MTTKECECGLRLAFVWCWDDPNSGHAHNVYGCDGCGNVVIDRVWHNAGRTTVLPDGAIAQESSKRA